jgi:hypothetical protein
MGIVKSFSDGVYLEYAQGGFDGWCVYIVAKDGQRIPPHDKDYFGFLQRMSTYYGADRVYSDFVKVYNRASITNGENAQHPLYGNDIRREQKEYSSWQTHQASWNPQITDRGSICIRLCKLHARYGLERNRCFMQTKGLLRL